MLTLYRRHRAKCKSRARAAKCSCPIWVQGVLRGEAVRKSLNLTNWEAANRLMQDWEVFGQKASVSVTEALERWYTDCQARNLSSETQRKYKRFKGWLIA